MHIYAISNTIKTIMPITSYPFTSIIKNKAKDKSNDYTILKQKVSYKKDTLIFNPYEFFCNISFDMAVGNKLIEAVRKVL